MSFDEYFREKVLGPRKERTEGLAIKVDIEGFMIKEVDKALAAKERQVVRMTNSILKARNDALDEAIAAVADAFWANDSRQETIKRIEALKTGVVL